MADDRPRWRWLAWGAVAAVFLAMNIGNIVSATGSGLACPDWPLCHARLVPPVRADVLIEYGHRLSALLVLGASVIGFLTARAHGHRRLGIVLVVLVGAQIALGGITVLLRLPHLISTAHLVNALLILGGLLLLASTRDRRYRTPARVPKLVRLARAGLVVLLLQLALGGYVRHTGAGLACPDFPLCTGQIVPEHWLGIVHWVHRWLGVAILGVFVHLALAARGTTVARASRLVAALAVLQVVLGITAVLLGLVPAMRAIHAAVGYALWGATVWLSARAGAWDGVLARGEARRDPAATVVHA